MWHGYMVVGKHPRAMSTFQKRGPQRNMTLYWIYGFTKRTKFCFKFQIKWKKPNTQDKIAIYPIKKKKCHAVGTKVAKQKYVDGKKEKATDFIASGSSIHWMCFFHEIGWDASEGNFVSTWFPLRMAPQFQSLCPVRSHC